VIESLHIEDLGVIEEADLVLSPGLTALTGETGAGKTMVLTSLGLLLGQRAESTIVRTGAERALVEGVFTLDGDSPAIRRAAEAGAELEDDELIVSRTVPASGRSRAHLGGRAVPSAVLSEVGAHLVSVHGQGDQFRLRSTSAQRRALDCLGGREHAAGRIEGLGVPVAVHASGGRGLGLGSTRVEGGHADGGRGGQCDECSPHDPSFQELAGWAGARADWGQPSRWVFSSPPIVVPIGIQVKQR